MARTKTIIKHCAKCNKPFSTADDSIVLCGECTDKKIKEEAEAELARQNQVAETRTCRSCGNNFDITVGQMEFFQSHDLSLPRLCDDCRKLLKQRKKEMGGMTHVCKTCGKTFTYTPLNVLRCAHNGWELFDECPECRQAKEAAKAAKQDGGRNKVVATLTCKDCGKEFNFTAGEQEFLTKHGLKHTPVRCPECRHKRKVMAVAENMRRFGDEDKSAVVDDTTPLDSLQYPSDSIVPPEYEFQEEDDPEAYLDITAEEDCEDAAADAAAVEESDAMSDAPESEQEGVMEEPAAQDTAAEEVAPAEEPAPETIPEEKADA